MENRAGQDDEGELFETLSQSLSGSFLTSGYKSASALLLYWQENDLGFEAEVRMLQDFLVDKYSINTTTFAIPSDRPEQALRKALSDFIFDRALPGTLGLVYYGGHSDPDEAARKSIWAAKASGPPTLDWFRIQPSLIDIADSDILIILDCCYAAQAARGRGLHKVELLAASGMGCRTPGVGKFSFTRALIDQMSLMSHITKGPYTISQLHARMAKAEVGLQTTPVLFNLSGSGESILFPSKPATTMPVKEGEAYYSFTVTVTDRPTKHQVAQISQWLKTAAPPSISDVAIDKILLKSQQLRQITEVNMGGRSRATLFESMPAGIQNEVAQTLEALDQFVKDNRVLMNLPENSHSKAKAFISELDQRTNHGLEILEEATLAIRPEELEKFEGDSLIQNMGISGVVNMLLLNMDKGELSPPKLPGDVEFASPSSAGTHFAPGFISGAAVIVEYIYYQEDELGGPAKRTRVGIDKLSTLLSRANPIKFRILSCIGSFHDPEFTRYGLVYRQSTKHDFAVLSSKYNTSPRLALERRFALAYALAESVMHFHLVGWLHQGLRSENIVILGDDYSSPKLLGFDYSRPDDESSTMSADFVLDRNIYRHPDRWGVPSKKFSKIHDLYALGVLLLEIGFWRPVKTTDKDQFEHIKKPVEVKGFLAKLAHNRLAYQMGEIYSSVTLTCLTGDAFDGISPTADDENRWKWQKIYREKVLAPLAITKALRRPDS